MTNIMGRPTLTCNKLQDAVRIIGASPLFLYDMFMPLWEAACHYGIDPVVMVAQSYHETGGGAFLRAVQPWFHNTCGLKVKEKDKVAQMLGATDEHSLCHAMFPSWKIGAVAQAQHLRAYCEVEFDGPVVSPRYEIVRRLQLNREPCAVVTDLSGKWAPSEEYGPRVQRVIDRLYEAVA